jgi:UDP-N-acetylglucosamine kinase
MLRTPRWSLGDVSAYEIARDQARHQEESGTSANRTPDDRALRGAWFTVNGSDRPALEPEPAHEPEGGQPRDSDRSHGPVFTIALGSIGGGRSRALSWLADAGESLGTVLNARDLELSRRRVDGQEESAAASGAEELQRLLADARERHRSVVLEGVFRSPALVSGVARTFAAAGFSTRILAVADGIAEVRMGATSMRVSTLRENGHAGQVACHTGVDDLLSALSSDPHVHRITIFDRSGALHADAIDLEDRAKAATQFGEAAASPLGTLRSAQWLSELRHMARFLAERRSAPRWALEELAELHEIALREILPALPVPATSEALQIQTDRLQRGLVALRTALAEPGAPEDISVVTPAAEPARAGRSL